MKTPSVHSSFFILNSSFQGGNMSVRHGCNLLALLIGVCFQSGCISTPWSGPQPSETPHPEETSLKAKMELPPEQAAEVCLGTAQALEKNGHISDAIFEYGRARNFNPK